MKIKHLLFTLVFSFTILNGISQTKNFIDQPYIEVSAKVDTLVIPDRIYLSILITEKDTKGKISLEQSENNMANALTSLEIDLKEQLTLLDVSSNFKKYFLKRKDVLKAKSYLLVVYDAMTAGKVIVALEKINISNVTINKLEHSKIEDLKLELKSKAVAKALKNAYSLTKPLNQKVGNAIYISDNFGYSNPLLGKASGIRIRGYNTREEYQPIDIHFEKIKIESQVNIMFKLEYVF